jgi:hypothetical protein
MSADLPPFKSPRHQVHTGFGGQLCFRQDIRLDDPVPNSKRLEPMELNEMQRSATSLAPNKSARHSAVERQLSPLTMSDLRDRSLLESPYGVESVVPRLNLDNHKLAGTGGAPTIRSCRARCPDGPPLVYPKETPRSAALNNTSRSHTSNAVSSLDSSKNSLNEGRCCHKSEC